MELTILQTSDAFKYSPMLRATSRTAIEYAQRHGFGYESFTGIKRGFHSAQAAFNRIMMLNELIDRGHRGWALYMDADAYIYDLDFDLRAYLADKQDRAAIMATIPDQTIPWHINSGVLFFNLGHPQGVELIKRWKSRFMAVPDEKLKSLTSVWDTENDQAMLYDCLNQDAALREHVLFEDARLFNHYWGTFIRQYLNSYDNNIDSRTARIAEAVEEVMRGAAKGEGTIEDRAVSSLYQIILDRAPDRGASGYSELIAAKGLARGIPEVVDLLLGSAEYKMKMIAKMTDNRSPTVVGKLETLGQSEGRGWSVVPKS